MTQPKYDKASIPGLWATGLVSYPSNITNIKFLGASIAIEGMSTHAGPCLRHKRS